MRRGASQHADNRVDPIRLGECERRREPARDRGVTQRNHRRLPVTQHGVDTRVPDIRVADLCRRVAQHDPLQALACIDRQPLTDQTAHGQAAKKRLVYAQCVQQHQNIATVLLNAVSALADH